MYLSKYSDKYDRAGALNGIAVALEDQGKYADAAAKFTEAANEDPDGALAGESLHLHARAISIPISNNKPPVVVEALAPDHMKDLLAACGWTPALDEAVVAARQAREAEQVLRAQQAAASNPPEG